MAYEMRKTLVNVAALNTKTRPGRFPGRVSISYILFTIPSRSPQMHQIFLCFSTPYIIPCVLIFFFYSESGIANLLVCTRHAKVYIQTTDWILYNHVQVMQNTHEAKGHTSVYSIIRDFFTRTSPLLLGPSFVGCGLCGIKMSWNKSLVAWHDMRVG